MNYEVGLTDKAISQLSAAAKWWSANRSPAQAQRWYEGFLRAIIALSKNPDRCTLARENHKFPFELRELHYGLGRRPTHRAVFAIRPNGVIVYAIRHLSQRDLSLEDL